MSRRSAYLSRRRALALALGCAGLARATPLALDDPADRAAFRTWFTFLAEAEYYRAPGAANPEVIDCAALARFAFREALRKHDGEWAARMALPVAPPGSEVRKYRFPHTPLGPRLFRTEDGQYAEFADARTLWRCNTHFIGRGLARARPGDLLFYRQLDQRMPFHLMIYLGASQFERGSEEWIVYHTGPEGRDPGEIRRPSVAELLRHPKPQWRPLAGNPNFLGVHRWNILQEELP